jgi:hypothetical protein
LAKVFSFCRKCLLQQCRVSVLTLVTLCTKMWIITSYFHHVTKDIQENHGNYDSFWNHFNVTNFIEYNAHTSIVHTWISQWFLAKKLFLFFKNSFTRFNYCKFIHHKGHLKPFLSYLPCIVHRKYYSIIFNVLKCALY